MARVFISHRNVGEDLELARTLHDALEADGYPTFLDVADLEAGDEWPKLVHQELEAADLFVVLLSQKIADRPDMLIEEVSIAWERRHHAGRPRIVPVCLGAGVLPTLPYDLAAMVKRLQLARWSGPADTAELVALLVRQLGDPTEEKPETAGEMELEGPEPGFAADLAPPKSPYRSDWYVPRPESEREATRFLREAGSPVVLAGPGDMGKSYFLEHLLEAHCGDEDRTVRISLDLVDEANLESTDHLCREIAFDIADQLGLDDDDVDRAWQRKRRRPPGRRLCDFLERSALASLSGRLLLAIDRADAIVPSEPAKPLFRELRHWAQLGGQRQSPWDRLRLLMAISTEPGRLIDALDGSPFNLSPPIRLEEFESEEIRYMAELHGLEPGPEELDAMAKLVGGHPYLTRKVLYQAAVSRSSVGALLSDTEAVQELFADHLRSRLLKLRRDDELIGAVRKVLNKAGGAVDPELLHRLRSSGLVAGQSGAVRMRYALYDQYFRPWLLT